MRRIKLKKIPEVKRNIWCQHYSKCLDKYQGKKQQAFDCSGCEHANDQGARPMSTGDAYQELTACVRLIKKLVKSMTPLQLNEFKKGLGWIEPGQVAG